MLNFHKLTFFLNQQSGSCVVITEVDLTIIRQSLKALGITKKLLIYPAMGEFPYDPSPVSATHAAERIKTLEHLKDQNFCLLISPLAWFEKRPIVADTLHQPFTIHKDDTLTHRHLSDVLILYSFQNTDTVSCPGQYAIRGDRVDLFPPNTTHPVRIDFFGDTVESIKAFDPISQKSVSTIQKITLRPANEFLINQSHIDFYRENYASQISETGREIAENMIAKTTNKNWKHLWPLFYKDGYHLSHFWKNTPSIFIEPTINLKKTWENIQNAYVRDSDQGRFILPVNRVYYFKE